jgi:lipoyl(octanoyl) transferase
MQTFTAQRDADTPDEIWFLEHPPVYTLGLNGQDRHILAAGHIPVVHVDRGGQVTYHGPGQLVVYPLLNLKRSQLGVRDLVSALEQTVIRTVQHWGIEAQSRRDAPGVYVEGRKLASVGLRIKRGCSYHGLAFNIDMDLRPFSGINPCGFENLEVTQLRALGGACDVRQVADRVLPHLAEILGMKRPASFQ